MTITAKDLNVKIFADGADATSIASLASDVLVKGFTTNPTLMRQAGISDYERFAHDVMPLVQGKPISFEVFSDEFDEMEKQAEKIATWGRNVYVKIPITNTRGVSSAPLIRRLANAGVQLNITAMFTLEQVDSTLAALERGASSFISIFAGRIADTGRDPLPIMREALAHLDTHDHIELIWASPREVLNVVQANEIGCHVITVTHDLLKKIPSLGKDLAEFSMETVQMFHRDAASAGYSL